MAPALAGLVALNTTSGDSDQDMVLDGIECTQGSPPRRCPIRLLRSTVSLWLPTAVRSLRRPRPVRTRTRSPLRLRCYRSNAFDGGLYHTGNINQNDGSQVNGIDGDGARGTADQDS